MNPIALMIAAFTIVSATQIPDSSVQPAHSSVFLVYDGHNKEWCAYTNESSWKSKVDSSDAAIVATLNYSRSRLESIDVTTDDEAGDWTVFDHYTLTQIGSIGQLERRVNILPGRRSVLETYTLAGEKPKLKSRETTVLTTGKKLSDGETWLPDVRIAARVADFQFASLAKMKYSEILSKGKVCSAAHPGAP